MQQGANDDSWMPMPMPVPAPMPMINFDAFDPALNFAWPDSMPDAQGSVNTNAPLDPMTWSTMDWSSVRNHEESW
jgi:hypothetical protein